MPARIANGGDQFDQLFAQGSEQPRYIGGGHSRLERIEQRVIRNSVAEPDGLGLFALEGHDLYQPGLELFEIRFFTSADPGLLRQRRGM